MKKILIFTSLFVLCMGCNDFAARQQEAELERRQQTVDDLRELGEEMHNKQGSDAGPDSTTTIAPESTSESQPESVNSSQ